MIDREATAKKYVEKSADLIKEARDNLALNNLRAVHSRAWYSVLHIVCAGTYITLDEQPPQGRPNWRSDSIPKLFASIMRRANLYQQYSHLVPLIAGLRLYRVSVDYHSPVELEYTEQTAREAIATAEHVREIVLKVMDQV